MSSVGEFIGILRQHQVKLKIEAGKFICLLPKGTLPDDIKQELLFRREEIKAYIQKMAEFKAHHEIIRVNRSQSSGNPLSFAQQRLWLIDRINGNSSHYNTYAVLKLEGGLNLVALKHAFSQLIARHESLRTVFRESPQGPMQYIRSAKHIDVNDVLHVLSLRPQDAELDTVLKEQIKRPFDLTSDYMLRVSIIPINHDTHLMLFVTHHIASDGWSLAVLAKEVSHYYRTYSEQGVDVLPALPIQYADFAIWQQDQWQAERYKNKLAQWVNILKGGPLEHHLPLDFARPANSSFVGARVDKRLSIALNQSVERLAKSHQVTKFNVLQSVFALLVGRLSNENDIIIGVPVAARDNEELAGLIGFFVNTLPIRSIMDWEMSFEQFLARNNDTINEAFSLADVPFDAIVDKLLEERVSSHSPLFQILFVLQNNQSAELSLPGIRVTDQRFDAGTTRFDLEIHVTEDGNGLALSAYYSTELFETASIDSLLMSYEHLLINVLRSPATSLSQFGLTTSSKNEVIDSKTAEHSELSGYFPTYVHQFLSFQAKQCPHQDALVFAEQSISYAELESLTNRFARFLQSQGVTEGQNVAMYLPRSIDMVIAVLAILKAGAAYVPIDTALPDVRVREMLLDLGQCVLITNSDCPHTLLTPMVTRIDFDDKAKQLLRSQPDDTPLLTRPADELLAYVLYTSGSTGKPKSIGMPHSALTNLVRSMIAAAPSLGRPHRVLQFASIGFDMSFTDIFLCLQGGGTLFLLKENQNVDISEVCKLIASWRISLANLPYSVLHAICQHVQDRQESLASLECVISTAERLKITQPISAFFQTHTAQLINHYGPSETHVVTSYTMPTDVLNWPELPPIGQAIKNVETYVLDNNQQLVPAGGRGVLYIAGPCLAAGYLNHPALTDEKFIHLEVDGETKRLYCTGDLVRLHGDGHFRYLGRSDKQFKLRGYRIEPGDIESALKRVPGIIQSHVCLRSHIGESLLVAYVEFDSSVLTDSDWQKNVYRQMRGTLPQYMIPGALVAIDHWPVTANGKVDESRLPDVKFDSEFTGEPISTEVEKYIAQQWASLLHIDACELNTSSEFFRLGGNSLLLTRMINQLNVAMSVNLSVKDIIDDSSIHQISKIINEIKQLELIKKDVWLEHPISENVIEI